MEEIVKFLKEAETYYLATVEGDQPRVRPSGTAHIFKGKLYIQTGKKRMFPSSSMPTRRRSCVHSKVASGFVSLVNWQKMTALKHASPCWMLIRG